MNGLRQNLTVEEAMTAGSLSFTAPDGAVATPEAIKRFRRTFRLRDHDDG